MRTDAGARAVCSAHGAVCVGPASLACTGARHGYANRERAFRSVREPR